MKHYSEMPAGFLDTADKDDMVELMIRMQTMLAHERTEEILLYIQAHPGTRGAEQLKAELLQTHERQAA